MGLYFLFEGEIVKAMKDEEEKEDDDSPEV